MSKIYSSVRLFSQNILRAAACLAVALLIFISAAQKTSAAAIMVDSLNDTIVTGDGCTLREAITNANSDNQSGSTDCKAGAGDDTISITVPGTINLLSALPDLLSDMTVIGLGASNTTVRRDDAAATEFRIFTKNSGTATISGVTIRDGINRGANLGTGDGALGGGILNNNGALTLLNIVVSNNQAIGGNGSNGSGGGSFGGGISSRAQLTISGSTVSGNFSTGGTGISTGGLGIGGGISSINAGVVTITNTVVSGNTATAGNGGSDGENALGGGIYASGTTTITVNNSQIVNNSVVGGNGSASGYGGGIMVNSAATILSVDNSVISSNNATSSPNSFSGGINNLGTTTITDSTLSGNISSLGGAIGNGDRLNLIRSTISGNTAIGSNTSGGVYNIGTLNVTNSTISGNFTNGTGGNNGGGIRTSGRMTLTNTTIANNSATGANSASGVFGVAGTLNVKNTIIATNVNNITVPDVRGTFVSQGYNLIGNVGNTTNFTATGDQTGTSEALLDPKLAPLVANGGATMTHALMMGSPAIDKGLNSLAVDPLNNTALTTDQRGFTRIVGATIDIGAFEVAPVKSRKRVRFF